MKVLSLGWGIQSFTLAAMAALGEIEKPDVAIHADTLNERSDTYRFAADWTPWLESKGVRVVTVDNPVGSMWDILAERNGQAFAPFYTLSEGGKKGALLRSCTGRWKIVPMRRWLQANRNDEPIEQWLGITTDEATRMKPSDVKYITNRWPLIELGMNREDCVNNWLENKGLEVPPRSACTFCPYHDTEEWRSLEEIDMQDATRIDEAIRDIRPGFRTFVHPARVPLSEVDLRTEQEKGQLSLWDDECAGICGI